MIVHLLSKFRVQIQAKVPDPCGSGSNIYLLFKHPLFANYEINTLNSIKMNILSNICYYLFHTTVLQYVHFTLPNPDPN